MAYVFDGVNKKIQLTSGTTFVEVNDLYSRWIEWLLTSDNSKYPLALRNVGGDPISEVKNLGVTFFLVNGWRIVPQSADHRLTIEGNLVTDPSGFSPIDTVPGYSIIVEYSVSNLVDSTLAQMPEIEYASFGGVVTINVDNGVPGTAFPAGTPQQPVNNFTDALVIANQRGFTTFFVIGNAEVASFGDYTNMVFIGESCHKSILNINSNAIVPKCEFQDATIIGTLDGMAELKNCKIGNLIYINGMIEKCLLGDGVITLGGGEEAIFLDCWCGSPNSVPVIDCGGSGQALSMRNYSGAVKIRNKTGAEPISITLLAGQVELDETVTNGQIYICGNGVVINNSEGAAVVDTTDLLNPDIISDAVRAELAPELSRVDIVKRFIANRLRINKETGAWTVYADDGTTPLYTGTIGDDGTFKDRVPA